MTLSCHVYLSNPNIIYKIVSDMFHISIHCSHGDAIILYKHNRAKIEWIQYLGIGA